MTHEQMRAAVTASLGLSPVKADRQFEASRRRPTPDVLKGINEAVVKKGGAR